MGADKRVTPSKNTKGKPHPIPESSCEAVGSSEDSDNGGVDDEGMARLMKALGDDGLDEFEQVQLHLALGGDEDLESGSDVDPEVEASGEEADESEMSEEDEREEGGEAEGQPDGGEVALDDVDSVDEDAVPRQKIEIDDKIALERIRDTIQLDLSIPWTETLTLSYPQPIEVDVNDDLTRELAFYKQALHSANAARSLAVKHKLPFTRPSDYFAEMVKSDAHMERIRQRLLDETASIKKSDEKRKEREGKKFGKQVQIEKLKERERMKKEMEERLKGLKRKRGGVLDNPQADDDTFDVAVENAIADRPAKRGRGAVSSKITRNARDQKYGFGGAGRRSKQNTKESTDNFESGQGRGGSRRGGRGGGSRGGRGVGRGGRGGARGGGTKRLGKSRRITARSKT